jgi:hypothetical protein
MGELGNPAEQVWIETLIRELYSFASFAGRRLSPSQVDNVVEISTKILRGSSVSSIVTDVRNATWKGIRWVGGLAAKQLSSSDDPNTIQHQGKEQVEAAHNELPQEAKNRRIIVVVSPVDLRHQMASTSARRLASESGVAILPEPSSPPREGSVDRRLYERNLLSSGFVLLQDPYRADDYFRAESTELEVARAKIHAFQHLCQLLGAVSVNVTSSYMADKSGNRVININGSLAGQKVSHQQDLTHFSRLAQELQYIQKNVARDPDYRGAEQYLTQMGISDRDFDYLITAAENGAHSLTVLLSTKAETDQLRARLATLDTLKISGKYSGQDGAKIRHHIQFKCEVSFH